MEKIESNINMKSILHIKGIKIKYKLIQDTYTDCVSVNGEVLNDVILLMPKSNPV